MIECAPRHDGEDFIPLSHAELVDRRDLADAANPAFGRDDDVRVLANDVRLRIEVDDLFGRPDGGATLGAEGLVDLHQFVADLAPQSFLGLEQLANLLGLGFLLGQFGSDVVDLQTRNAVQCEFEDGIRLSFIQRERLHQLLGGVLLAGAFANEFESLVESVEDDGESLQDVNPLLKLRKLILIPAANRLQTESRESERGCRPGCSAAAAAPHAHREPDRWRCS